MTATVSVTISSGTIIGTAGETVDTFNGIPYADAPIGNLRFRPPVKLSRHLGTFDATGKPLSCPQGPVVTLTGLSNFTDALSAGGIVNDPSGEDEASTSARKESRPALASPCYSGSLAAAFSPAAPGVTTLPSSLRLACFIFIFVAVNYRVAAWGFMPGKEILAEGSGNTGLLDQRMGLEWVADNIWAFGGDPGKVTIWGQSSGSISVFEQLVLFNGDASYNGKPLFRGTIMNSGSATPTDPLDSDKAQAIYDAVATSAGCLGNNSLLCLRILDNNAFAVAADSVSDRISYSSLALSYLARPDAGRQDFHDADEGQITKLVNTYSSESRDGSPHHTGIRFESYLGKKRIAAILGDIVFNLVRRISLQTFASVTPTLPTWSYFSSYKYDPVMGQIGTYHGSDIRVLFNDSNDKYPKISGRTYYINFLHNLDPNNGSNVDVFRPQWKYGKQLLHCNANSNGLLVENIAAQATLF
ncbi:alpha/beta-hydrolase [Trichoderma citrinoviride]|uniref:Carboxylic ester hydrolase n=1 Tax=Trichoderma citrinoviride TaxID=58853 RepID=A0A2T4BLM4_9HYPO|nr:alpha/beta-hydrolase [Trichoderma citrinoviride]PTB70181.1 alpha/beta-hydrolase [Trichoderma citrinoviride]